VVRRILSDRSLEFSTHGFWIAVYRGMLDERVPSVMLDNKDIDYRWVIKAKVKGLTVIDETLVDIKLAPVLPHHCLD